MFEDHVIIAGGGLGGFTTALTLHQIGVPCLVLEQVASLKPLGVGINLQPNAVRELMDLGFTPADMDGFGVPAREYKALVSPWSGNLCRAAWHRCRLQLAAICGAPRQVPYGAVSQVSRACRR